MSDSNAGEAALFHAAANPLATASLEGLARPLLELLQELSGLHSAYLTTIDERAGEQHILFARNSSRLCIPEGMTVPWQDTLCQRALADGRPYCDDVMATWGDSDAARELGIHTYLSEPIHTADGELFGTLCAAASSQLPVDAALFRLMRLFAGLIARQVDREHGLLGANQRAAQAERELADLRLVTWVSALCAAEEDLAYVLRRISTHFSTFSSWKRVLPFRVGEGRLEPLDDAGDPECALLKKLDEAQLLAAMRSAFGPDSCFASAEDFSPEVLQGLSRADSLPVHLGLLGAWAVCDQLEAGILCATSMPFEDVALEAQVLASCSHPLSLLAGRTREFRVLRQANAELASHAFYDSLTGIPNRRLLIDELQSLLALAERDGGVVHVGFLDLDGFKAINDKHGHDMGDRFLAQVARQLASGLRESDRVARYGGDEFVVLSYDSHANGQAKTRKRLTARLAALTTGRYRLADGVEIDYIGASIGVVSSRPGERDADMVLKRADEAMYKVKQTRCARS